MTIERKTRLRRTGRLDRSGRLSQRVRMRRREVLRKIGKKARAWAKVRAQLKREFEAVGITRCEVCGTSDNLGFAHRLKRRHITTEAELRIVALLCNRDHDAIELLGEEKMRPAIEAIIERRAA